MEQFIEVLSNFGFPIACCGVLMWYIFNLTKQHKEEVDKMTEAINGNTIVLTKILERLGS